MARAAGDSAYYKLSIIDQDGRPVGKPALLPSVTHILKAIPKTDAMTWWGYRLGIKAVADYVVEKDDFPGGDVEQITATLYDTFKQEKRLTPNSEKEAGGTKGTGVHKIAENLFKIGPQSLPEKRLLDQVEVVPRVEGLLDWYANGSVPPPCDMEVIAVEVQVFSLEHWYAGTLDLILCDKSGDVPIYYLIDFKTSKGIYPGYLLQLTAYEHAAKERGYIPQDAATVLVAVNFLKEPKSGRHYEIANSSYAVEDFLVVKGMWTWMERERRNGASI